MFRREVALSVITFAFLFVVQESVINQVHLPLGGFSLPLIAAIIWSSISEPEIGAITGFIAGMFMDLSPSNSGPFGQWILVLTIACFTISYLGYGDDALNANPAGLIAMASIAVISTLVAYILTGMLFGLNLGESFQLVRTIFGIGIWSALLAPILVPFIARVHSIVYSGSK